MKKSRIQKLKNKRENSPKDAPQRQVITRQDMDRMIFDMVMSEIYENSDVNELLYDEILSKYRVQLPEKEKQRLWDVLTNTTWVSPKMGFGQAGKLELTQQGYQLMSQYGSYSNYVEATQRAMPAMQIIQNPSAENQSCEKEDNQKDKRSEKKNE